MSGIFVDGYGFASADILRDAKSVIEAEIQTALSITGKTCEKSKAALEYLPRVPRAR